MAKDPYQTPGRKFSRERKAGSADAHMTTKEDFMGVATLISPEDTWALWTVLALSAALSIYLEQKYAWASKITGCILATVFTLVLAKPERDSDGRTGFMMRFGAMWYRWPYRFCYFMPMSKKSGKNPADSRSSTFSAVWEPYWAALSPILH